VPFYTAVGETPAGEASVTTTRRQLPGHVTEATQTDRYGRFDGYACTCERWVPLSRFATGPCLSAGANDGCWTRAPSPAGLRTRWPTSQNQQARQYFWPVLAKFAPEQTIALALGLTHGL
jgi:hypothetical protein